MTYDPRMSLAALLLNQRNQGNLGTLNMGYDMRDKQNMGALMSSPVPPGYWNMVAGPAQRVHPTTGKPILRNPNGSGSTERTIGIDYNGKYYNIPTIVNGVDVGPEEAIRLFKDGKNNPVGVYGSRAEGDAAAVKRTNTLGEMMSGARFNLEAQQKMVDESVHPTQPSSGTATPAGVLQSTPALDRWNRGVESLIKQRGLTRSQAQDFQVQLWDRQGLPIPPEVQEEMKARKPAGKR